MSAQLLSSKNLKNYWGQFKRVSPWDAMLIYMVVLVAYGIYEFGASRSLPYIFTVIPIGAALDYALHRAQNTNQTGYPRSGLISLLIVVSLMPFSASLLIANLVGVAAILSKHFLRLKNQHIFNPAAFGVGIGVLLFGLSVGWWADAYAWLVIILGLVNVWRIRKFWQIGGFILVYTILNLAVNSIALWQTSNLIATVPWFFMLFMLPEPKTSLRGRNTEITFGVVVAVAAIGFQYAGVLATAPLIFGLLSANLLRIAKI